MAKRPTEAEMALVYKYKSREKLYDLLVYPLCILASAVPLLAMQSMVSDLAGKDTNVNVALGVTISWSVVASGGWALSARKAASRKKRLEAGRGRTDSLEAKIMAQSEEVLS